MADKEQWERLPELFAKVEELQADGHSDDEIKAILSQAAQYEWDTVVQRALDEGTSQEQIDAWTAELQADIASFEDDDPEDAIDAADPEYGLELDSATSVIVVVVEEGDC